MNPYQTPETDPPQDDGRECPDCGAAMVRGTVTGSAYWMPQGTTMLRRLVSRGEVLLGGSFRITVRTPRMTGHRCAGCGLVMIRK
jgi:hypothetical protein